MLGIMYDLDAHSAMRWCQTCHDMRLCPMDVGSPQTQEQRAQVIRILGRVHARRRQARIRASRSTKTSATPAAAAAHGGRKPPQTARRSGKAKPSRTATTRPPNTARARLDRGRNSGVAASRARASSRGSDRGRDGGAGVVPTGPPASRTRSHTSRQAPPSRGSSSSGRRHAAGSGGVRSRRRRGSSASRGSASSEPDALVAIQGAKPRPHVGEGVVHSTAASKHRRSRTRGSITSGSSDFNHLVANSAHTAAAAAPRRVGAASGNGSGGVLHRASTDADVTRRKVQVPHAPSAHAGAGRPGFRHRGRAVASSSASKPGAAASNGTTPSPPTAASQARPIRPPVGLSRNPDNPTPGLKPAAAAAAGGHGSTAGAAPKAANGAKRSIRPPVGASRNPDAPTAGMAPAAHPTR